MSTASQSAATPTRIASALSRRLALHREDGVAALRELVGLALCVGQALDELGAQRGARHDVIDEHLGGELVDVHVLRVLVAQDVDVYKLASEMLVDDIVPGASLRAELIKRLAHAESKAHEFPQRRNAVFPV